MVVWYIPRPQSRASLGSHPIHLRGRQTHSWLCCSCCRHACTSYRHQDRTSDSSSRSMTKMVPVCMRVVWGRSHQSAVTEPDEGRDDSSTKFTTTKTVPVCSCISTGGRTSRHFPSSGGGGGSFWQHCSMRKDRNGASSPTYLSCRHARPPERQPTRRPERLMAPKPSRRRPSTHRRAQTSGRQRRRPSDGPQAVSAGPGMAGGEGEEGNDGTVGGEGDDAIRWATSCVSRAWRGGEGEEGATMERQGVAEARAIRWAISCASRAESGIGGGGKVGVASRARNGIGGRGGPSGASWSMSSWEKGRATDSRDRLACLERCAHRVHDVVARGPDELMGNLVKEPAPKGERRRRIMWAGREPAGTAS